MKFLAILQQEGGCDYTIGCGLKCIIFDASSRERVISRLRQMLIGSSAKDFDDADYSDDSVDKVTLYKLDADTPIESVDLRKWREERDAHLKQQRKKETDEFERQEFERLSQKFGAKG